MRLYAQGLVQGSHLGRLTPVGPPSDPSPPLDGPKEAGDLALGKAFTAQARPTLRAAGPSCRVLAAFGSHGFDEVDGEHAGPLSSATIALHELCAAAYCLPLEVQERLALLQTKDNKDTLTIFFVRNS